MLFRKKIPPQCAYCSRSVSVDDDWVVCRKKGLISAERSCRRFRYDPLRRIPEPVGQTMPLPEQEDADFSL